MTLVQLESRPPSRRTYPRPLESIHQIEITSRCNLRCVYCPSPHLPRPKLDISRPHFERALQWCRHFERAGTQGELSLTGIGEALLHPLFPQFCAQARQALPDNPIGFSTNGLLVTEELCRELARLEIGVFVSLHRPEKAGPAIQLARRHGVLVEVNSAPADNAFDWAGQVDWHVSAPRIPCEYLRSGWGVVLADGRVTTCCLDASGAGVVGHVSDEIGSLSIRPYSLCEGCHMVVP